MFWGCLFNHKWIDIFNNILLIFSTLTYLTRRDVIYSLAYAMKTAEFGSNCMKLFQKYNKSIVNIALLVIV